MVPTHSVSSLLSGPRQVLGTSSSRWGQTRKAGLEAAIREDGLPPEHGAESGGHLLPRMARPLWAGQSLPAHLLLLEEAAHLATGGKRVSSVSGCLWEPKPQGSAPTCWALALLELVLRRQLQLSQLQGRQGETVLGAGGGSLVLSPGLRAVKTQDANSKRLRPQS